MFLACGNDIVVLFVALETMAISFYILAGYLTRERRANEAAMKYMLMGAFSSGVLAYGFSILYGIAGSTNLQMIQRDILQRQTDFPGTDLLTALALATVTAGVFFRIGVVPFHQWAPDVCQGGPTPIAASRIWRCSKPGKCSGATDRRTNGSRHPASATALRRRRGSSSCTSAG